MKKLITVYTRGTILSVLLLIMFVNSVLGQGNAMRFDNMAWRSQGDFVYLGSPNYNFTDKLTVAVWIKWEINPGDQAIISAHEKEGALASLVTMDKHNELDMGPFSLKHNSKNAFFEWRVNSTNGSSPSGSILSATVPTQNNWVYLTGVYDGADPTSTMKFYVNGVLERTQTQSVIRDNIISHDPAFRLNFGRLPSGYRLFSGLMDEVRIYNRALTQEEIRQQMFKKSSINATNLVGYWAFDETTGTTVSDQGSQNVPGKFYTALIDVHQVSTPPTYELTDGDKVWIVNHYQNKPVMTVAGAGVDNEYIVASNTTNTLTLASPWLTTPIVDGNANMTWMAYEDPTESTQWLVSSAPLSENASLINTNTQTSVGTGGVVKLTITSTPSSENNLGVVQLGSSSGTPVSTGETFPTGITMRSNLTWNIQEWGTVIANLIFDYSGFEGISDPTSVVLLRRVRDSQTWTEVTPTSRDNAAMTFTLDGQTDFYEYAIGSNSNNPLPVELISFTSKVMGNRVNLFWETATEIDNYGFRVERSERNSTGFKEIGFVEGAGTSNSPKFYGFTDNLVTSGKYFYRLKQLDNDGNSEFSPEIEVEYISPKEFSLKQNYPNPFNPSTIISFSLLSEGLARLEVFDPLGRVVEVLLNENRSAGHNEVVFNASNLPGGVYFYRLTSGGNSMTKQMILVK
mgnify:CR=1 FL=1